MCSQTEHLLSDLLLQVLKFEEVGKEGCKVETCTKNKNSDSIDDLTSQLRTNLEQLSLQVMLRQQKNQSSKRTENRHSLPQIGNAQTSNQNYPKSFSKSEGEGSKKHNTFWSVDQLLQCINDLSIKSNGLAIGTVKRLSGFVHPSPSTVNIFQNKNPEMLPTSMSALQRNLIREQANPLLYNLANQLRLYATLYYSKNPSFPNSSTLLLSIARLLNELLLTSSCSSGSPIEGVRLNEAVLYNLIESLLPYIAVYEASLRMEHFRSDCFLLRNVLNRLTASFNSAIPEGSFTDAETLLLVVLQLLLNVTTASSFATAPNLLMYRHYQISPHVLESTVIRELTGMLKAVFGRYAREGQLTDFDLVLLKVHRLFDLCYVIVKGHDKEFYYMAECLTEIEFALGSIVEQVGEERFCTYLIPIEDEVAKSGRDARMVPFLGALGGLFKNCSKSFPGRKIAGLERRAMVVLLKVIQAAIVWRRSRRTSFDGGSRVPRKKKVRSPWKALIWSE